MIEVEVEVEADAWAEAIPDVAEQARRAASAAAESEGAQGAYVVLLADDDAVQRLNAEFRGKDQPTNVLSFPAPDSARSHRGDVALAYETCAREAEAQGKPLLHHLQHLTVHGILHLLGFDHMEDAEAEAMEARERAVLAGLGVPDPYREDAD